MKRRVFHSGLRRRKGLSRHEVQRRKRQISQRECPAVVRPEYLLEGKENYQDVCDRNEVLRVVDSPLAPRTDQRQRGKNDKKQSRKSYRLSKFLGRVELVVPAPEVNFCCDKRDGREPLPAPHTFERQHAGGQNSAICEEHDFVVLACADEHGCEEAASQG